MNATLLYRIAAFILVLFAAGHTLGFLKFKAPTPEGVAVQQAMDNVRFSLGSKSYTYGDFYRGFGLFCTAYLLFAAFLAWHLGTMARSIPQAIGALGWVLVWCARRRTVNFSVRKRRRRQLRSGKAEELLNLGDL
jgi:hypothetical protein